MRHCFVTIALSVCSLATAGERPTVGLLVSFPSGTPAAVQDLFRQEVQQVLQPAPLELRWRSLEAGAGSESFNHLVVIRFQGNCTPGTSPPLTAGTGKALGMTHVSNGSVLPFVDIDCGRVLNALEAAPVDGPFRLYRLLGRALGRVAAHEVHHVITASSTHEDDGIMKRAFNHYDLAAPFMAFNDDSLRKLRRSLGGEALTVLQAKASTGD